MLLKGRAQSLHLEEVLTYSLLDTLSTTNKLLWQIVIAKVKTV